MSSKIPAKEENILNMITIERHEPFISMYKYTLKAAYLLHRINNIWVELHETHEEQFDDKKHVPYR